MRLKKCAALYSLLTLSFISLSPITHAEESSSDQSISLPLDHGAHPETMTEWWYYTGHLRSTTQQTYGFEVTFFRTLNRVYFVHMALTDEARDRFTFSRDLVSGASVSTDRNAANLRYGSKASLQQEGNDTFRLVANFANISFELHMQQAKEPLFVNSNGTIDMAGGGTSKYYSFTRLTADGQVTVDHSTTDVTGQAWMDHQWGDFVVTNTKWDWFSFQMDDGTDYNLFSFRNSADQSEGQYINEINAAGARVEGANNIQIQRLAWWQSPHTGNSYVTRWRLTLPDRQEVFTVDASMEDQELYPTSFLDMAPTYWEGRCHITRTSADGTVVRGVGYIEHFPYQTRVP